jgi:hypothetical protein
MSVIGSPCDPVQVETALHWKLLDESDRGKELLMRAPMRRVEKTVVLVRSALLSPVQGTPPIAWE